MVFSVSMALAFFLAYLTGSIPTAVWAGKIFHNIDVREHGSGNAGATNTIRVLGFKTGIPVLLIDILKGWVSVKYMSILGNVPPDNQESYIIAVASGLFAVIGHIYPLFAGFRGGKGVATIFGVVLALSPFATLLTVLVFSLVLTTSKYVSLGSLIAAASYPFCVIIFHNDNPVMKIFSVFVALLIIFTHRKNISRLLQGKENKADFLFRKKISDD